MNRIIRTCGLDFGFVALCHDWNEVSYPGYCRGAITGKDIKFAPLGAGVLVNALGFAFTARGPVIMLQALGDTAHTGDTFTAVFPGLADAFR